MIEILDAKTRLDQPELCPDDVYQLLLQCWTEDPQERPKFCQIEKSFRKNRLSDDRISLRQTDPTIDFNELHDDLQKNNSNVDQLKFIPQYNSDYVPMSPVPVPLGNILKTLQEDSDFGLAT
jgi:hypothetical protein